MSQPTRNTPARLPAAGRQRGGPPWMSAGLPAEKSMTFWPSAKRLIRRLQAYRRQLLLVITIGTVSVALSVYVPRLLGHATDVIFSGVGKSGAEIDFALKLGIGSFNVESAAELDRLELHAQRLSRKARISVRVNPDIDAGTHPYISTGLKSNKFGVPRDEDGEQPQQENRA